MYTLLQTFFSAREALNEGVRALNGVKAVRTTWNTNEKEGEILYGPLWKLKA